MWWCQSLIVSSSHVRVAICLHHLLWSAMVKKPLPHTMLLVVLWMLLLWMLWMLRLLRLLLLLLLLLQPNLLLLLHVGNEFWTVEIRLVRSTGGHVLLLLLLLLLLC